MRFLRILFITGFLLLTAAVIWAGIYTRTEGFTQSWRSAIEKEFGKRGYHVSVKKVTLGAFRGLVAEDLRFFLTEEKKQEVAFVDDVYLDVDLSRIFQDKKVTLRTLDVRQAKVAFPIDPENPDAGLLTAGNLSGRVIVTENAVEIPSLNAVIQGVNLTFRGVFLHDAAGEADTSPAMDGLEELAERRRMLASWFAFLDSVSFGDQAPELNIDFRGELSDQSSWAVTAAVNAPVLKTRDDVVDLTEVKGLAHFVGEEELIRIETLSMGDAKGGQLILTAEVPLQAEEIPFSIESNLDWTRWKDLLPLPDWMDEVVFFEAPQLQASGKFHRTELAKLFNEEAAADEAAIEVPAEEADTDSRFSFPGHAVGEWQTGRIVSKGEVFAGLSTGFHLDGERFYLRNLRLDHKTGALFLNAKYEPGNETQPRLLLQTEVKMDPAAFLPFLNEKQQKLVKQWQFDSSSSIFVKADVSASGFVNADWELEGALDLRNVVFRDVAYQAIESEVFLDAETLKLTRPLMTREEGVLQAEQAEYLRQKKGWQLTGVKSSVDLVEGMRTFSTSLAEKVKPFGFSEAPTIELDGWVDSRKKEDLGQAKRTTKLDLTFASDAPATYRLFDRAWLLEEPSGALSIDADVLKLTNLKAGWLGGALQLNYTKLPRNAEKRPFEATIRAEGVPYRTMMEFFGKGDDSLAGLLSGTADLKGTDKNLKSISGEGAVAIRDGDLFELAVLGPLSDLLSERPRAARRGGIGNPVAKEAHGSFTLAGGVLKTGDLCILFPNHLLQCAGTIYIAEKEVEGEAILRTGDDLTQALTAPIAEFLAYSCDGTFDQPNWKPKNVSAITRLPLQIVEEIGAVPVEGLRAIGQGIFGKGKGLQLGNGNKLGNGNNSNLRKSTRGRR